MVYEEIYNCCYVIYDDNILNLLELVIRLHFRFGWFMVFNVTFNNISVISWRLVLLVEETGVPEENHRPGASH